MFATFLFLSLYTFTPHSIFNTQLNIGTLEVEPQRIQLGKSAKLNWEVKGAKRVFISGIGEVKIKGGLEVKPKATTRYTLIAEGPFGVVSQEVTLAVEGSRGVEYPLEHELISFRYPITIRRRASSLLDLFNGIHDILQNQMKFSVRGPDLIDKRFLFLTNLSERSELVQDKRRVKTALVSYLVEVENPPSLPAELTCTIKLLIKYQNKAESTYRTEGDEDLYRTQSENLKRLIDKLP